MFTPKIGGIKGAFYRAFLTFGCLPFKAYVSIKSIVLSLYRMLISHNNLLEWTTSEDAEKNSKTDILSYYRLMAINLVFAALSIIVSYMNNCILGIFVGMIWAIIPLLMSLISKSTEEKQIVKSLKVKGEV